MLIPFLSLFQFCKSREPVSSSKGLRDTNFDVSYDEVTKKYKVSCRRDRIHTYDNGDQTCTPTFATESEILKACETDATGKCGAGSMWTLDMCTDFRFARLESLTFEVMSDWGEILKGKSKSEAIFDYCKTFAYGLNKLMVDNPAIHSYLKSKFIRVQSKELKAKVEDKIVTIHWDIKTENLEAVFADAKASPIVISNVTDVQFATDVVKKLSSSSLSPRFRHAVVSVGSKVVIWGGYDGNIKSDGAIFDVSTNQWVEMPKGLLTARYNHSSAAVGSKVVIWGGGDDGSKKSDGAIFDVSTNQWVEMPKGPLTARTSHSSAAVGSKVVIWGGYAGIKRSDGAIFDVSTNQWSETPEGPLSARYRHSAAAIGSKVVIWGGFDGSHKSDGAIFDVATMTWMK
jgi:hypothetical protein